MLLYSHDSYGLGHLRRTINIAERLVQDIPTACVLIATGSACATRFTVPPRVDIVKLPAATKNADGNYIPRSLTNSSFSSLLRLRTRMLAEIVRGFRPDLVLVDHKVTGLAGELLPALEHAKRQGAQLVLGLRDIIDSPERVAAEWSEDRGEEAMSELYDSILVYGEKTIFDPRTEYCMPPAARAKVLFTGYVVRPTKGLSFRALPTLKPQVLVTVGGGEDGAERIERYLDAIEGQDSPWSNVIVLGPLLENQRARRLKRRIRRMGENVKVHSFYEDLPRLVTESAAVVSMAGYNTTAEILRANRPAVLLPRLRPRMEQLMRAQRFEELGLATSLSDPAPEVLHAAVESAIESGWGSRNAPAKNGLKRAAREIARQLGSTNMPAANTGS